ncbi:MAG: hypothetical protein WAM42_23150 [Candidatus Nitrosopolaris sp.]
MIYKPMAAAQNVIDTHRNQIYIVNESSGFSDGTVSVINGSNDRIEYDIRVGKGPVDIAAGAGKYYVSNSVSNTVSVIDGSTATKAPLAVHVGINPGKIGYDADTNMIYVFNQVMCLYLKPTRIIIQVLNSKVIQVLSPQ